MPSSIMGLGSPSAKKRALGIPSGRARAVSACGTAGPRSGIEQPATTTRPIDSTASDAISCKVKTLSHWRVRRQPTRRAQPAIILAISFSANYSAIAR